VERRPDAAEDREEDGQVDDGGDGAVLGDDVSDRLALQMYPLVKRWTAPLQAACPDEQSPRQAR
jgi:hypothetical protein